MRVQVSSIPHLQVITLDWFESLPGASMRGPKAEAGDNPVDFGDQLHDLWAPEGQVVSRYRRSAMPDQISSTTPKGHAPERNP